jgi:carbamoyltransferase
VGLWRGENGRIERLDCFPTSASIGWFYSNVTEALGWWHGDGEGKTMGLAPYGDATKCEGVLDKFHPKFENGSVREHHEFGQVGVWNEGGAIHYHFDDAYEIRDLISKHGRENIAAEAQRILEEQVQEIIYPWLDKERTRNLSASGGVMLNVKLNQRLWESAGSTVITRIRMREIRGLHQGLRCTRISAPTLIHRSIQSRIYSSARIIRRRKSRMP